MQDTHVPARAERGRRGDSRRMDTGDAGREGTLSLRYAVAARRVGPSRPLTSHYDHLGHDAPTPALAMQAAAGAQQAVIPAPVVQPAPAAGASATFTPGWVGIDARARPDDPSPFQNIRPGLSYALGSLRVVQLQAVIRGIESIGDRVSHTGRKAELVQRIVEVAERFAALANSGGTQAMLYLLRMVDVQFQYGKAVSVRYLPASPGFIQAAQGQLTATEVNTPVSHHTRHYMLRTTEPVVQDLPNNAPPNTHTPSGAYNGGRQWDYRGVAGPLLGTSAAAGTTHLYRPAPKSAAGPIGATAPTRPGTNPAVWYIDIGNIPIKPFPFYKPIRFVAPMQRCPTIRAQEVRTARFSFTLTASQIHQLMGEQPTHVLYLVSASYESLVGAERLRTKASVLFPFSAELTINSRRVPFSFKGSKKHPGRVGMPQLAKLAPPTDQACLIPGYLKPGNNRVEFNYRATSNEFDLGIVWAEVVSSDQIIADLKTRVLPKEEELKLMRSLADDEDIITGAAEMPLTCPVRTSALLCLTGVQNTDLLFVSAESEAAGRAGPVIQVHTYPVLRPYCLFAVERGVAQLAVSCLQQGN